MLIIPAIDIKDGCVVRFVQGRLKKKIYSSDPLKVAKAWVRQGAKLIHIVDLDGAKTGIPKNLGIIKEVIKNIDVPIEVGGGIRKIETIKDLLDCGAYRVVLGTRAIEDEDFLKKAFAKFKNKIIVSLDAKAGYLLTKGWQTDSQETQALTFARKLKNLRFKEIIYTDILKDGTLKGPNIKGTKKLLEATGIRVIASGGICSLKDIRQIKVLEKEGLTGIIVGKALYEKKFTLGQALELA